MRGIYVALLFLHVEVSFELYIEQVKVDGIALVDVGQVKIVYYFLFVLGVLVIS